MLLAVGFFCLVCPAGGQSTNPADINQDGIVDILDLAILAADWLGPPPSSADIYQDGNVNMKDFTILAANWLSNGPSLEDMVLVPGGKFLMGDHLDAIFDAPVHAVYLDSFYICRYEVTNQQYCDFLNEANAAGMIKVENNIIYASDDANNSRPYLNTHSYDPISQIEYSDSSFNVVDNVSRDRADNPVLLISYYGANAYCDFFGYRLPTEAEWEYAARGGEHDPYHRFPWGDTISHSLANYFADSVTYFYDISPTQYWHPNYVDSSYPYYPYTSPVGSFTTNSYGLYDMAGNVWEWCADWYGEYEICDPGPCINPTGPESGILRVLRGGAWGHRAHHSRVAFRITETPDHRHLHDGFRIALDY